MSLVEFKVKTDLTWWLGICTDCLLFIIGVLFYVPFLMITMEGWWREPAKGEFF